MDRCHGRVSIYNYVNTIYRVHGYSRGKYIRGDVSSGRERIRTHGRYILHIQNHPIQLEWEWSIHRLCRQVHFTGCAHTFSNINRWRIYVDPARTTHGQLDRTGDRYNHWVLRVMSRSGDPNNHGTHRHDDIHGSDGRNVVHIHDPVDQRKWWRWFSHDGRSVYAAGGSHDTDDERIRSHDHDCWLDGCNRCNLIHSLGGRFTGRWNRPDDPDGYRWDNDKLYGFIVRIQLYIHNFVRQRVGYGRSHDGDDGSQDAFACARTTNTHWVFGRRRWNNPDSNCTRVIRPRCDE